MWASLIAIQVAALNLKQKLEKEDFGPGPKKKPEKQTTRQYASGSTSSEATKSASDSSLSDFFMMQAIVNASNTANPYPNTSDVSNGFSSSCTYPSDSSGSYSGDGGSFDGGGSSGDY